MAKVVNFKNKLRFYFNLIDTRKQAGDLWGVLDATRSAMAHARTKIDRRGLNLLMGQTYFEMGQYMLSCEHFFRAVAVPHLRSAAFFGVARNLICMRNFDLALEYLDATLKWDAANTFTGAVLEWSSVMKNKMREPDFAAEKLLRSARVLLAQEEFIKADELLKNLQPTAEVIAYRAFCAFLRGQYARSRELGFAALELDSDNVVARCVLAEMAKSEKDGTELEEHLHALEGNPTEKPAELLKIALLFASLGCYDRSMKFLQKLQQIDEFNAKNHLFSALCCHNLKKEEDALFHISRAHWLDFENPLYIFFYNLIKSGELPDEVLLKNQLPPPFQAQKLENLNALLYGGKFCQELSRSCFLLDDLEWSFSLRDEAQTDATSFALASCTNKKSLNLVSKLLVSPRPAPKQKFLIARNALLSNNFLVWTSSAISDTLASVWAKKNSKVLIKAISAGRSAML